MEIQSSVFQEGEAIPAKYTCQGVDINPPLSISGVPTEAKSLALIVDDPDVPAYLREDRMWVHWVIFNISPRVELIHEGVSEPLGVNGSNTGGENRYMGPCPPDREHRYFFKLYALDCKLDLPEGSSKDQVLAAMEEHVLAEAELMGRYEKS